MVEDPSLQNGSLVAEDEVDVYEFPLSYAQERVWFTDQLEPGNATYNITTAIQLKGALDLAALRHAFAALFARHSSLRTRFEAVDGVGVQLIDGALELEVELEVLPSLPVAERAEAVRQRATAEAARPFELEKGPMLRARVLRLDEHEHVLLLTIHHIISDGWSTGILVREIAQLYAAKVRGEEAALEPLELQYADFTVWQREALAGEALARQVDYWKRKLAGAPALLALPTDRPRPAEQSNRGAAIDVAIDRALSLKIDELAKRRGMSPFMVLLAGLNVVLSRYAGQKDVVVGTMIANRTLPETEGLIGFFANVLALRTVLRGDETVEELLADVKETAFSAYANQDIPFEKVLEELKVQRSRSHVSLYQVMLILHNAPMGALELPGLVLSQIDFEAATVKHDLQFDLHEGPSGIVGKLSYATDLFDRATVERLVGHLNKVLAEMVAAPAGKIFELPMMSDPETLKTVRQWNATERVFPVDGWVHQQVATQAAKTPQAIAVSFEGESLTYAELDRRSNQLAQHLQRHGVGPDKLVGICVERSLEMVIGLLGIMKAGGAYVPLDPGYPRDRLAYMVEDTGATLLLTQERLLSALPPQAGQVLCLDRDWPAVAAEPASTPTSQVHGESLAYMIYTSGSTGRPKGAMNRHEGIRNRLLWMQAEYGLTADDVVLQKTPFSFDVSVWEFFWPLMTGARLVVARPGGHQDPGYLSELIEREGVTTLHFVPSMLGAFLEEPEHPRRCRSVRQVMCSGEALPYELQERFFERMAGQLHNLYGPTEAAVDVTYWPCERGGAKKIVPIGRPVANTEMLVLDEHRNPVPVGVAGELFIGGVQLGRGYLDRADLTADRFIPNPFASERGERMYRTGDLARWLPEGTLEYLGRIDHQVKIRGFRIELGEIESALTDQPGVKEAVVLAREDVPGDLPYADRRGRPDDSRGHKRLVAYVVGEAVSVEVLRQALGERLPEYMVPSVILPLDALPLSPNGKIDRKALPVPERTDDETAHVAPRTPVEIQLAQIWKELLQVERVGVHDNFFTLGGDSVRSIQVVARAKAVGILISPRIFLDDPTIEALARKAGVVAKAEPAPIVEQPKAGGSAPSDFPLAKIGQAQLDLLLGSERDVEDIYPLSPMQEGMLFNSLLGTGTGVHIPQLQWLMTGQLDLDAFELAWQRTIERFSVLRTSFHWKDLERPLQVVHRRVDVPFVREDVRSLSPDAQAERLEQVMSDHRREGFALERAPLLRFYVQREGERAYRFVWTHHHLLVEAWSFAVVFAEMLRHYDALVQKQPLEVQPERGYQRYIAWLAKQDLAAAEDYFRDALEGFMEPTPLPSSHAAVGEARTYGEERLALPPALTKQLDGAARRYGLTLNTLVQGSWAILLGRYAGEEDVVFGATTSGRPAELEGVESIVGLFINTTPVRVQLDAKAQVLPWLKRLHQEQMLARQYEYAPLAKVQGWSDLPRGRALFESLVLFQNMPMDASLLPRIKSNVELTDFKFRDQTHVPLTLYARMLPEGMSLWFTYDERRFDRALVLRMLEHLSQLLEQLAAQPDKTLGELSLKTNGVEVHAWEPREVIGVAATFTAEPLKDSLDFWLEEHKERGSVAFAPYGQVFQALLEDGSVLLSDRPGLNVVLVRFGDWDQGDDAEIAQLTKELIDAVRVAAGKTTRRWLIVHCPESPAPAARLAHYAQLAAALDRGLASQAGVIFVDEKELQRLYPVATWHDAEAEEIGKIPYTEEMYAALGTLIARKRAAIRRAPYKVVALDCDETLWRGVVGEDGPAGVRVEGGRRWLQEFMVEQRRAGMLLCLCSKNDEDDVEAVFKQRPEMPLTRSDIVATKINWRSKADNLAELSQELGLGLDSCIFVDDNPRECAEVVARHPEVLVLELPRDDEALPAYLQHVWAFDRVLVTDEDRRRTEMYRQNAERTQAEAAAPSLASFLERLELKVEMRALGEADLERASQLTQRTNQFNLSTVRRSAREIADFMRRPGAGAAVVEVRDRFGDYGQVGLALHEKVGDALRVDTLLLSCRVLGKGVEHRVLNWIGEQALKEGASQVLLRYEPTKKNRPARDFLESTVGPHRNPEGYDVPAGFAARVQYDATLEKKEAPQEEAPSGKAVRRQEPSPTRTAVELRTPARVLEGIRRRSQSRGRHARPTVEFVAPTSPDEEKLAGLWSELLGVPQVGRNDKFFDLGGDSVHSVQLISRIRSSFGVDLPIQSMFTAESTLADLAARIGAMKSKPPSDEPSLKRVSRDRYRAGRVK